MRARPLAWLLALLLLAAVAALVVWRVQGLTPETAARASTHDPRSGTAMPPNQSVPMAHPAGRLPMPDEAAASAAVQAGDQASPAWFTAPQPLSADSPIALAPEAAGALSNRQERAARRAKIQQLQQRYLAKGPNATLQDAEQVLAELQAITAGSPGAGYIAAARESVAYAAQAQSLAQELQRLQPITSEQGAARQQEILAQLRNISQRMVVLSSSVQQSLAAVQRKETP